MRYAALVLLTVCAAAGALAQDAPDPKKAVLARINEIRKQLGLPEVEQEDGLSVGCQKHADYLARNQGRKEIEGAGMHREETSLPSYSDEGKQSARQSLVSYFGKGRRVKDAADGGCEAVDGLAATLYHRLELLSPRLTTVGIGITTFERGVRGVVVIDVSRRNLKDPVKINPVICPGPDQTGVATLFSLGGGEYPDPRPDGAGKVGYPITVVWDTREYRPTDVTATLETEGKKVEFALSTPEKPARADKGQPGVICLLPKEPLKPGAKYSVTVECRNMDAKDGAPWSKTWSFTTSK